MTPNQNRLDETVLMIGHKICFYGDIFIVIHKFLVLHYGASCLGPKFNWGKLSWGELSLVRVVLIPKEAHRMDSI